MKNKLVIGLLITATAGQSHANNTGAGAIIGGLLGAAVGAATNQGSGQGTSAIIGAIAGSVIGATIGYSLDQADRRALAEAQRNCLQSSNVGQNVDWNGSTYGSRTNSYGSFTSLREGRNHQTGERCRSYRSVVYSGGKKEVTEGIACYRANGSWYETSSQYVTYQPVHQQPVYVTPTQPQYPNRPPQYRPQPPVQNQYGYGQLGGYCADQDHQQFMQAKSFAYSPSGLNLDDRSAINWALRYNETHACGTISEYANRFKSLYQIAYSPSGLNKSSGESIQWALARVEYISTSQTAQMSATIRAAKEFAYSPSTLNLSSSEATNFAERWVSNNCEDSSFFSVLTNRFRQEYQFAYSPSGLNMSSGDAMRYASRKVAPMSRCGHLIAQ